MNEITQSKPHEVVAQYFGDLVGYYQVDEDGTCYRKGEPIGKIALIPVKEGDRDLRDGPQCLGLPTPPRLPLWHRGLHLDPQTRLPHGSMQLAHPEVLPCLRVELGRKL